MTTGGPDPISTFGIPAPVSPPRILPTSQKMVKKPSMPTTINRSLSRRRRFFSAGGMGNELWLRAAYGGGRDVFRGGMAKCIVWRVAEVRTGVRRPGRPDQGALGGENEGRAAGTRAGGGIAAGGDYCSFMACVGAAQWDLGEEQRGCARRALSCG